MRKFLDGLVVEEFQKTRRVLVAECPRRVQLLARAVFGADGQDHHFQYYPDLTVQAVLGRVAVVPGLS
eukprot:657555-Pyramimonas_sp.AAC.1